MRLLCLLPTKIEAVPITLDGEDYVAIRKADVAALFGEPATIQHLKMTPEPEPSAGDDFTQRVLDALPGPPKRITALVGAPYRRVYAALMALRKRGLAINAEGMWRRVSASELPPDLRSFLLAELATGPRDTSDLMRAARKAGLAVEDRFAIDAILSHDDAVIGDSGSRWTLARRPE